MSRAAPAAGEYAGAVRLMQASPGGSSSGGGSGSGGGEGAVLEVYFQGRWGPIAGLFTGLSALVACRQLGHGSGRALRLAPPPGTPLPAASDVSCSGRESSLADCQGSEWLGDAMPALVAGVACGNDTDAVPDYQVRLRTCTRGHVDVAIGGAFGAVCLKEVGDAGQQEALALQAAQVVCRGQGLGDFPLVSFSISRADFEGQPIWMGDLACTGAEESLDECPHQRAPAAATACTHLFVDCVPADLVSNATAGMCTQPVGDCQREPLGCSQGFCHWAADPPGALCGGGRSGTCDARGNCLVSSRPGAQYRQGDSQ